MEKQQHTDSTKKTKRRSPLALLQRILPVYENGKTRHFHSATPAPKAHKLWRRKTQRYKVNDRSGRKH